MLKTKAVSKKTEQILLRVLKYIEKEPRRLRMNSWGDIYGNEDKIFSDFNGINNKVPPCRTTACLGGTVLLITKKGKKFLDENMDEHEDATEYHFPDNSPDIAADILGITEDQVQNLFYFNGGGDTGWPIKYDVAYKRARTAKQKFKVTKARVLHFIKTGR